MFNEMKFNPGSENPDVTRRVEPDVDAGADDPGQYLLELDDLMRGVDVTVKRQMEKPLEYIANVRKENPSVADQLVLKLNGIVKQQRPNFRANAEAKFKKKFEERIGDQLEEKLK